MNSLSYQETLNIVEKFMIDSGIRQYCTEVCKGKCCGSCRKRNDETCQHHEERRLSCSIYLCSKIYELIPIISRERLECVNKYIIQQYNLFNKLMCCRKSIYFTARPKIFFETVRFPMAVKTELQQTNAKTIKSRINKLTEEHKKGKRNEN